jgi:hypothetical protein
MEQIQSWKDYEAFIFNEAKNAYPTAKVTRDYRAKGILSKVERQVDILVVESIGSAELKTAIECKFYNKKVDIKAIESMIGMAQDLKLDQYFIVTNNGYSESAYERVQNAPDDVELEILKPQDLAIFEAPFSIAYAGYCGALITAPFGWVVDGSLRGPASAFFYQTGLKMETAIARGLFMYLNFWGMKENNDTIDDVYEMQAKQTSEYYGDMGKPVIVPHLQRLDYRTVICKNYVSEKLIEIRGYIDFPTCVPFFSVVAPAKRASLALKKMKHVVWNTMPMPITHSSKS